MNSNMPALARDLNADPSVRTPVFGDQPPKTVRLPIEFPPRTAHAGVHGSDRTPPPSGGRRLALSSFARAASGIEPVDESGSGLRVGDTFLGFHLVEELGQGAFARVFLAHQESLAGRPVALKVTLRPTREAERLARLQHTNVVPVYSVHNAPPAQVICMPYLGRRTIADVIRAYRADHPSGAWTARKPSGTRAARTTAFAESKGAPHSVPGRRPNSSPEFTLGDDRPALVGDPAAVLRVVGQLAAGLAHAHARNILHLDIKPANVLLPDVGEPMLLDFNLSFDTTTADRELVGGTVPYMATEQLIDLRTRGQGAIDGRTDLYSLGVMAFEMLTGEVPFPASSRDLIDMDGLIAARRNHPPSVRALNPLVSPAVEAIVRKLLAPEPADRYQSADDLKTDIDRHQNDLPLLIASEPSPRERFGKWRRRNPGVPARLFAACVFGLCLGLGGVAYQKTESAATTDAVVRATATRASLDTTRLDLILPGDSVRRARGVKKAEELLAAYGLPDDANWTDRPVMRKLPDAARTAAVADLGELMVLLAQAKWQEAEPKGDPVREEAAAAILKLTRAARSCFPAGTGPKVLDRLTAELAFAVGEKAEPADAADGKPTTRARFLDATAGMAAGKYADAQKELKLVLADEPTHPAANFCLAYCKQQLGDTDKALEGFDVAERFLPGDPRPAFQRGVLFGLRNNPEEAEKEFNKAIARDADDVYAHLNRGFTRFRTENYKDAEADLTRALQLGAPAYPIYTYRSLVRTNLGDGAGCEADRRALGALEPKSVTDFMSRGMARLKANDADGALADFKAAAELNPRAIGPLQNQLHVLADKMNRPEAALIVATKTAELFPDSATARITRALLLARRGDRAAAHAEVAAAQSLSKDREVTYRAACVYSLTSVDHLDDRAKALALLDRAIKDGYRNATEIATNRDLDPIRDNDRFRVIERATASLFQ